MHKLFITLFGATALLLAGAAAVQAQPEDEPEEEEPVQAYPRPYTMPDPSSRKGGAAMEGRERGSGPGAPVMRRGASARLMVKGGRLLMLTPRGTAVPAPDGIYRDAAGARIQVRGGAIVSDDGEHGDGSAFDAMRLH